MNKVLQVIGDIFRRFSFRESLVFLFFLVLAGLIWYGHAINSVRNAILPVTVTYTGIPQEILFGDTLPNVIYIEARDAGKRLKAYQNHLEVTFDLSSQLYVDSGKVVLSADLLRNTINAVLQGTTKLQLVQPEQIQGAFYRQYSKKVPVNLQVTATPAMQYQLVGEPVVESKEVVIYGKKNQLDTIRSINTAPLLIADIKDTVHTSAILTLPFGIRAEKDAITVTLIAEQFTEKVFTLPIGKRHVPKDIHLRLFPSETTVHLRVGVAHFGEINEADIHVYCDFPHAPADKLPIHIQCNNPLVTYSRCTPSSVEFLIEK